MFSNRKDAAKKLAEQLNDTNWHDAMVVALPRGGVPIGDIVAKKLDVPLELVVPRKIASPDDPEYAIGAISEEGEFLVNPDHRDEANADWVKNEIKKEKLEAERRGDLYRCEHKRKSFKNKQVIIVDDGIATGLTMRAAIQSIRRDHPKSITIAVPTAAEESLRFLRPLVDAIVCLEKKRIFMSVGAQYKQFKQVSDDDVARLMKFHCKV